MAASDYNYLAPSALAGFIHTMSGVTNEAQAALHISDAEVFIDSLAGAAPKFYPELTGTTSAVNSGTTFNAAVFGSRRPDYWARGGVYVEIVDSTTSSLVGTSRLVVGSDDNKVTLVSGFGATVPAGTEFRFKQRSQFPRWDNQDVRGDPRMPDQLSRIIAYQVEFAINEGSEEFGLSDTSISSDPNRGVSSRSYASGYSEARTSSAALASVGAAVFIAPKARVLMRRLLRSTGVLRG